MSCDWNIHCVDCESTCYFSDANHQDDLMALLIENKFAIAALAPLLKKDRDVELRTMWGAVDIEWFEKHLTHRLVPIDEYGHLQSQCREYIEVERVYDSAEYERIKPLVRKP